MSEQVQKPQMKDHIKTTFIDHKGTYGDKGKRYGGIDFASYAFALEKYVAALEQKLKDQTEGTPKLKQLHFAEDGFSEIIAIYSLWENPKTKAVRVCVQVIARDPDKQPEADKLQKKLLAQVKIKAV